MWIFEPFESCDYTTACICNTLMIWMPARHWIRPRITRIRYRWKHNIISIYCNDVWRTFDCVSFFSHNLNWDQIFYVDLKVEHKIFYVQQKRKSWTKKIDTQKSQIIVETIWNLKTARFTVYKTFIQHLRPYLKKSLFPITRPMFWELGR